MSDYYRDSASGAFQGGAQGSESHALSRREVHENPASLKAIASALSLTAPSYSGRAIHRPRWEYRDEKPFGGYDKAWPASPFLSTYQQSGANQYFLVVWPEGTWWVFDNSTRGEGGERLIQKGKESTVEGAAFAAELYVVGLSRPVEDPSLEIEPVGRAYEALPTFGGMMDALTTGNGSKLAKTPKSTGEMLTDAVAHGAKVAAADEASTVVLNLAKMLIGESYPEFFKSKQGEDIAKIITATAVYHMASNNPGMIPGGVHVAAACSLVIEASARDIIQPQIGKVGEMFKTLGALGAGLGAGLGSSSP